MGNNTSNENTSKNTRKTFSSNTSSSGVQSPSQYAQSKSSSKPEPQLFYVDDNSDGRQSFFNNVHDYPVKETFSYKQPLQERNETVFDVKELLELSRMESSHVVLHLKDRTSEFKNTVFGRLTDSLLEILMKIIRKICFADNNADKFELLKIVCCDNFFETLGNYISNIPTHQQDHAKDDLLFFERDVVPFFETVLSVFPKTMSLKMKDMLIKSDLAIKGLEQFQNIKVGDATKIKLKKMELMLNKLWNRGSSESSDNKDVTEAAPLYPKCNNAEDQNLKSGSAAQAKHLNFLIRNVFPNLIKNLDVPAHRVRGVRKNIFFVDSFVENEGFVKEAEFLLALTKYLLKQNYKANNLLILTTSEVKMQDIVNLKRRYVSLKDVPVGIVNDIKDTEASIILISFAITEADDLTQNIYDERQLCKILLKARNGIYMTGNLILLEKQSLFWKELKHLLLQYQAVSSKLPLFCEIHQIVTTVSEASGFNVLQNGGCSSRCEQILKCGHLCKRLCHIDDRDHSQYKCREPCNRKLNQCKMNHICPKRCYEVCDVCNVKIQVNNIISECHKLPYSHNYPSFTQVMPSTDNKVTLLPCGHNTTLVQLPDHLDLWSVELVNLCEVPCSAVLECGHKCFGTCGTCRQGRVHIPCRDKRKITLACGHRLISICSAVHQVCTQKCFYECPHGKCKEKCGVPCSPCEEMCTIGCEHSKCTKKCSEPCNRRPCFQPCKKLLSCGHPCLGICGEPCPLGSEYCRVCSAQKMKKKDSTGSARFVWLANCNHVVRSNDLDKKAFGKGLKVEALACPICGFNITKTTRYLNYCKELHKDLHKIRNIWELYNKNLNEAFWKIAKEIKSVSLPSDIAHHPKIEEIKKHFQKVIEMKNADLKTMILLMFLRNLLWPVLDGPVGMASPHHFDWLLYLILDRFEMGFCSQILRELYKEVIEYQKLKGRVYKSYLLELHKAIAFFTYLEKNTWAKCKKGHLTTFDSFLTECSICECGK